MNIFTQRLKELRKERGLSIPELSAKAKIPQQTIHVWERGEREPSMGSIIKLCRFFGCTSDFLIGLTPD